MIAVAGVISISAAELAEAGIQRGYALIDVEPDVTRCMREAGTVLTELARKIAADWLPTEVVAGDQSTGEPNTGDRKMGDRKMGEGKQG